MRAWQVKRHGEPAIALELEDVPAPEPPAGFLRVRTAACALGLPDLFLCRGSYARTPPLPFTPGQELVGVVTAAGEGATAKVGDRVMGVSGFFLGHGGFAEEALVLDDFAFRASDELDDAEAAGFVIPFHTAWVGLVRRAALREGESLLVLGGAGGTGAAAIQLGQALGARVVTTAGDESRAAFCRELGAEEVVLHRSESIAERVREWTHGRGIDVVYDPVGGEACHQATRCIAQEGRLLLVGFASGAWGPLDQAHLATPNYSALGVIPSGYDRAFRVDAHARMMALHREGGLRVPVGQRSPFESLPEALEALARGEVQGKSVLEVG